jgi:hypothetical protein
VFFCWVAGWYCCLSRGRCASACVLTLLQSLVKWRIVDKYGIITAVRVEKLGAGMFLSLASCSHRFSLGVIHYLRLIPT